MARLLSLNVGRPRDNAWDRVPVTGIDKRPVTRPLMLRDPGPPGVRGGAGVDGDSVCDERHHGGHDQAVYAYAREDLDEWAALGRELACGVFGENLTTVDLPVSEARIGERWLVGDACVLEVTAPRIPCRTFAGWLGEDQWIRRFTEHGAPGAYLRVLNPGLVRTGDPITVRLRPPHDVTITLAFRALTTHKQLAPTLRPAASALPVDLVRRLGF